MVPLKESHARVVVAQKVGNVAIGEQAMRMGEVEMHECARQLLAARGERAIVEAAQKAYSYETKGQTEEAVTWRRIEAALKLIRGPHLS
jgi:hypothetical protein